MKYLCHRCCDLLKITSNEIGVNKVGRKDCYGCGDNSDWSLHVADQNELDPVIDAFNASQKSTNQNNDGKRQLCATCDEPTGRCEEDSIYLEPEYEHQSSIGPLCEDCCEERLNVHKDTSTKESS